MSCAAEPPEAANGPTAHGDGFLQPRLAAAFCAIGVVAGLFALVVGAAGVPIAVLIAAALAPWWALAWGALCRREPGLVMRLLGR